MCNRENGKSKGNGCDLGVICVSDMVGRSIFEVVGGKRALDEVVEDVSTINDLGFLDGVKMYTLRG